MKGSAKYGTPPNTETDLWIVKGIIKLFHIPPGVIDPTKGFPLRIHPPPNYHYERRGIRAIASVSVVITLIVLITGGRLLLRWKRRDLRWGPDDWVIIPAAMSAIAWMAITIPTATQGGLGKHIWDVTYMEYYWYFKFAVVKQILFFVSAGLIKISISLFNRRLTGLSSRNWMYAHNVFLFLIICYTIIAVVATCMECRPLGVQFSLIKLGHVSVTCLSDNRLISSLLITHVVFDFALLSVPLLVLYKMRMNTSRKVRLAFLFSVGSISCVGSAVRLHLNTASNPDRIWAYAKLLNWTIVDIFFGITAASLPVLNAAIPKRWRSPPDSIPTHDALPALGFANKRTSLKLGSGDEEHDDGRYLGQFEMRAHAHDTLRGEKSYMTPASVQPTEWEDPAHNVQFPIRTHRDRLSHSGGTDNPPV